MAVKKQSALSGVIFALLLIVSFNTSSAQAARLSLEDGKVWVRNLDAEVLYTFTRYFNTQKDWESIFPVSIKENTNGIVIPGDYKVFKDAICFTPRFPFAQHVIYQVKFDAAQLANNRNEVYLPPMSADGLELEFSSSKAQALPAEVLEIFPTSSTIPENLLKFHLTFSKSMTTGAVYSKVKLFDRHGKEVEKPFLIVDHELWDDQMKTVTLLFDPGRIKRGLRPNLEMKPALAENENYTLVVEEGWKDIDGLEMRKSFTKTFRCTKPDRVSPHASVYRVIPPTFETSSLIVNLSEPHDYVLLTNCLQIIDANKNVIEGKILVRNNESSIEFVPKNPWLETHYTIRLNPLLEDLAGNNMNRLFDEDLTRVSATGEPILELNFKFNRASH